MELNKIISIVTFLVGIFFVVIPIFFRNLLLPITYLSMICFGSSMIFKGFNLRNEINKIYSLNFIIIGIIMLLFGVLCIFYSALFSYVIGFEFYIICAIFIILGLIGFLSNINRIYDLYSIITILVGIASIAFSPFIPISPVFVDIALGFVLCCEGFAMFISN